MLHAESFSLFHVSFILQMILVVFIKKTEQIWINLKIQVIIAVLFMVQNITYFIAQIKINIIDFIIIIKIMINIAVKLVVDSLLESFPF